MHSGQHDAGSGDECYPLCGFGRPSAAQKLLTNSQRRIALAVSIGLSSSFIYNPRLAVVLVVILCLLASLFITIFRAWAYNLGRLNDKRYDTSAVTARPDGELPSYSVLVPLYREAEAVAPLARHLARLDYPSDRLEVILICEPDDSATIAAIHSLNLNDRFRLVLAPGGVPKTKPRACNVALMDTRGEYCVVYDAEDRPALNQLRRAAEIFAVSPANVLCLQAKLDYHNHSHNWLTRCFAIEYSYWFDLLLPGLAGLDLPIPLGGTSNHFPTSILRALGGWDPYNVTEDADLGIRLHLAGGRTRILDSVTLEEACAKPGAWIRQRTRWMKGYLQTWLVHSGQRSQWRTRLAIHALIGGTPLYNLLAPVILTGTALFLFTPLATAIRLPWLIPPLVVIVTLLTNAMTVYAAVLTVAHRGRWHLLAAALSMPAYALLAALATYRAVWQLVTRPFYWEKTPHGLSGADTDPACDGS